MEMTTRDLFNECNRGPWVTGGEDVQYRIIKHNDCAIVAFQATSSKSDWRLNFSAWVRPYRDMPAKWRVHAGFLRGYKSIREEVMAALQGEKCIIVTGLSLGGAYATLLHEDLRFNRRDAIVTTFVFGSPRVVWLSGKVHHRFAGLIRIEHARDIVTKLPFWLLGYRHVGGRIRFGRGGIPWYTFHFPEVYENEAPHEVGMLALVAGEL